MQCGSVSPTYKDDIRPRQCRLEEGHKMPHWAVLSDAREQNSFDEKYDYDVHWIDEEAGRPATEEAEEYHAPNENYPTEGE